jgi:hypothetical protein
VSALKKITVSKRKSTLKHDGANPHRSHLRSSENAGVTTRSQDLSEPWQSRLGMYVVFATLSHGTVKSP